MKEAYRALSEVIRQRVGSIPLKNYYVQSGLAFIREESLYIFHYPSLFVLLCVKSSIIVLPQALPKAFEVVRVSARMGHRR